MASLGRSLSVLGAMVRGELENASDAHLLSCFAAGRDERAFAEIVRRHGPMVMGVARRMLRSEDDAEDAFQATFLALASAVGKTRWRPVVAGWLYQTAVRSARSVGRMNARWARRLEDAKQNAQHAHKVDRSGELRVVLDEELGRLPEKYRAAVVLCDLESLSRREAAGRLGLPVSTVRTHLSRGRELLRSRLSRRGVAVSTAALVAGLSRKGEASAPITAAFIKPTTAQAIAFVAGRPAAEIGASQTVIQIATGVTRAMSATKFGTIAVLGVMLCLSSGLIRGTIGILGSQAVATTVFFDGFDDGSFDDGEPVEWTPNYQAGDIDASSGDLVLTPMPASVFAIGLDALDFDLQDTSVRVQGRVSSAGGFLLATARNQDPDAAKQYFGVVSYQPQRGGTVLALGRSDGLALGNNDNNEFFGGFPVLPFDVRVEDAVVQLDVIGNQLSLWGWKAGEPKPFAPQLIAVDDTYASGFVRIGGGIGDNGDSVTTIRSVHVANASIPEPATVGLVAIGIIVLISCPRRRG